MPSARPAPDPAVPPSGRAAARPGAWHRAVRTFENAGAAFAEWLSAPGHFGFALGLYLAAIFVIRGFLFPAASGDDAEQILFAQSLEPGYMLRNPPLYSWLLMALEKAIGVSTTTPVALRMMLLGAMYLFLHRAALLMFEDRGLAALAALSPVALYFVGWDLVRSNTNSVLLATLCAATLYVLLRLERSGRTGWYLALGAAVGLGMLSKYNFGLFAVALIAAALGDRRMRARLLDRRSLVALGIAAVLFLPHGLWAADGLASLGGVARTRFAMADSGIGDWLRPFLEVPRSVLGFLLPLLIFLLAFLRPAFGRLPEEWRAAAPSARDGRMLGRFLLILIGLVTVLAVVTGAGRVPNKYLLVLLPFPLWFFARVQAARLAGPPLHRTAGALAATALVIPAALLGKLFVDPLYCRVCYFNVDYGALAADMRAQGFRGGTVYSHYYPYTISGNLRPYFPDSRFVSTKHPGFVPPERTAGGACAIVWSPTGEVDMGPSMTGSAAAVFGFDAATAGGIRRDIEVPIRYGWGRTVRFSYRLISDGAGTCH